MTAGVTSITKARAQARRRTNTKVANHRTATFLIAIVGLLVVIGLGATLSASSVVALDGGFDRVHFFRRQAMWVGVGAVAMFSAARVPYQWYRRLSPVIFGVSAVGLVAVLAIGIEEGGATRWIDLGFTSFQPSELSKFAVVVFLAAALSRKERLLGDFAHFFAPVAVSLGLTTILLLRQPDFGTTLVVAAGAMAVILVSAAPLRHVLMTGALGLIAASVLAVSAPYRMARLTAFLSDDVDLLGAGYQLDQSLQALGTGGLFGIGLGQSRARWLFLPNAHTDFIFSIIGEEMGFAGAMFIVALFVALAVLGLVISLRAPDRFGRLLAIGLATWIVAQAFVNIGGVVGIVPISGIPLPFVSYGGTALVMAMASAGVLINIARQGRAGGIHRRR